MGGSQRWLSLTAIANEWNRFRSPIIQRYQMNCLSLNFPCGHCTFTVVHLIMIFSLNPAAGQPLYLQLMQQIRHGIETGVLQNGDELPGIRTLAKELVVSHNTVAKAYSELQHEGLLELRHGSGAYVSARRPTKSRAEKVRLARSRVQTLVESLRQEGLSDEEMHRLFEAELFYPTFAEERD
jgi:GntR family transcriptional regulator